MQYTFKETRTFIAYFLYEESNYPKPLGLKMPLIYVKFLCPVLSRRTTPLFIVDHGNDIYGIADKCQDHYQSDQ